VEVGGSVARRDPLRFSGRLEPNVALVKAVPGGDGRLIDAAVSGGTRGVVVEALPGAGGIPPAMIDAVAAAARAVPVVVASRAPYGAVADTPTGGTGEPLRELDLLSAGRLTAEQAWLLLMAALADAPDEARARARFRDAVAALT
jgi:L-asparaginase